jgi:hypothetical protein
MDMDTGMGMDTDIIIIGGQGWCEVENKYLCNSSDQADEQVDILLLRWLYFLRVPIPGN